MTDAPRKIRARRRGNALGFWCFKVSLRCFGLRGAYGLLYIVCTHYLLFDRTAVRGALAYVRRRFPGQGRLRHLLDVHRLFVSQGRNLIDRFYLISGAGRFNTHVEGVERVRELLAAGRGLVLVTAHVGNWQTCMAFLDAFERKVNLVMRPEDNPAVQDSLRIGLDSGRLGIISPEGYLGGVVEMMNALRRGEIVSLMGDRSYGFSPRAVEFLGDRAWMASGAYHVAALAGCPVVVLLSAKTGVHDYEVGVAAVSEPRYVPGTPKADQLGAWVQEFARVLERYLDRHPYQCFLFDDLWQESVSGHGVTRTR